MMIVTNEVEVLEKPLKSPSDRKDYKLFKLANGLKVLLVKNDSTKDNSSAAVALTVDFGSFEDPPEVQGLAHFLEHMVRKKQLISLRTITFLYYFKVFMGSQKYPKENEFDQYIKNRNGFDNAMTEVEHTIFYFSIGEENLSGALDRFSQFFINPLMSIDSMEREVISVESEFQNNIYNDAYRINQIFASMARDFHPVKNFTWGNLKTLKNEIDSDSLYRILHDFWKRFYKSNRMNLCIQTSMNIDILQSIVVRYFSDIKPEYGSMLKPIYIDPFSEVFNADFYKKIYFVKSLTKKRKIFLTFLLPSIENDYKDKSLEYLSYLFTHEGRNSLNAYLKNKSLALHLTARVGARNFEGNSLFTFFTIEVSLTREGYENIGRVLDSIFSYLLIIKMTPMEMHRETYDEFKTMKEILFKYRKEKSLVENVQELALNMRMFKDVDVIIGREACGEFSEAKLNQFISQINEKRFNLMILSDKYQKYNKIEKWFGTEYAEVGELKIIHIKDNKSLFFHTFPHRFST